MKKIVLLNVIGIVLILGALLFKKTSEKSLSHLTSTTGEPTSTPLPFVEMTIPYLRARQYQSSLGEKIKYQAHGNYTSYLTSYISDGLKINGLLTIPGGTPPQGGWPGVVFVHGYIPPSVYKTTEKYIDYVDYLARNGFVVFKIDLRGNGDSEGHPVGAYYSGGYVIDTLNAYGALQSSDFVNPSRIGLWGHSMAGNVTFRAFVAKQNIPALVIWAGAVYSYDDLVRYRINDQSYRPPENQNSVSNERARLQEMWGNFDPLSFFWKQVPATNYLNGVHGALQINHAIDDSVVNIGYSRDLIKILDTTSIVHELHEYKSGGHNISGVNFANAMKNTVEFYKNHL